MGKVLPVGGRRRDYCRRVEFRLLYGPRWRFVTPHGTPTTMTTRRSERCRGQRRGRSCKSLASLAFGSADNHFGPHQGSLPPRRADNAPIDHVVFCWPTRRVAIASFCRTTIPSCWISRNAPRQYTRPHKSSNNNGCKYLAKTDGSEWQERLGGTRTVHGPPSAAVFQLALATALVGLAQSKSSLGGNRCGRNEQSPFRCRSSICFLTPHSKDVFP